MCLINVLNEWTNAFPFPFNSCRHFKLCKWKFQVSFLPPDLILGKGTVASSGTQIMNLETTLVFSHPASHKGLQVCPLLFHSTPITPPCFSLIISSLHHVIRLLSSSLLSNTSSKLAGGPFHNACPSLSYLGWKLFTGSTLSLKQSPKSLVVTPNHLSRQAR